MPSLTSPVVFFGRLVCFPFLPLCSALLWSGVAAALLLALAVVGGLEQPSNGIISCWRRRLARRPKSMAGR